MPTTGSKKKGKSSLTSKAAFEQFKYEVANELGVILNSKGSIGNLSTKSAGNSSSSEMFKKIIEQYKGDFNPSKTNSSGPTITMPTKKSSSKKTSYTSSVNWNESDHPRNADGEFVKKKTTKSASKKSQSK